MCLAIDFVSSWLNTKHMSIEYLSEVLPVQPQVVVELSAVPDIEIPKTVDERIAEQTTELRRLNLAAGLGVQASGRNTVARENAAEASRRLARLRLEKEHELRGPRPSIFQKLGQALQLRKLTNK